MRKWRQIEAMRRTRIASSSSSVLYCSPKEKDSKGHFVVYSMDRSRFVIPLKLLKSEIIVELLKMAEDEFGFSGDQPIVLPFESHIMNQIIKFLSSRRHADEYDQHQLPKNINSAFLY
ncbi:Auxin-responsive protein SAUR36 [Linum perenne]